MVSKTADVEAMKVLKSRAKDPVLPTDPHLHVLLQMQKHDKIEEKRRKQNPVDLDPIAGKQLIHTETTNDDNKKTGLKSSKGKCPSFPPIPDTKLQRYLQNGSPTGVQYLPKYKPSASIPQLSRVPRLNEEVRKTLSGSFLSDQRSKLMQSRDRTHSRRSRLKASAKSLPFLTGPLFLRADTLKEQGIQMDLIIREVHKAQTETQNSAKDTGRLSQDIEKYSFPGSPDTIKNTSLRSEPIHSNRFPDLDNYKVAYRSATSNHHIVPHPSPVFEHYHFSSPVEWERSEDLAPARKHLVIQLPPIHQSAMSPQPTRM